MDGSSTTEDDLSDSLRGFLQTRREHGGNSFLVVIQNVEVIPNYPSVTYQTSRHF